MIPVTTFANKTVAVFGLGSSGNATALALMAGGARTVLPRSRNTFRVPARTVYPGSSHLGYCAGGTKHRRGKIPDKPSAFGAWFSGNAE